MTIKHNTRLLKRFPLLLIAFLLVGLFFSGCTTGSQPRGWSGGTLEGGRLFLGSMRGTLAIIDTSTHAVEREIPLEITKASSGLGCSQASLLPAIYGNPAVDGKWVYLGDYNGRIYAFDSSTGSYKPPRYLNPSRPQPIIGGPLLALGNLYFGSTDGYLYALDPDTLDERWSFKTGDRIWSTPATNGVLIFIGSFD